VGVVEPDGAEAGLGQGERAFIVIHGIAAFIFAAGLILICFVVGVVQLVVAANKPELKPRFPAAITATITAALVGVALLALPANDAYSKATADDITGWIALVALWWVWWNRMGRKGKDEPKPKEPDPPQ
jgi:hypothetical protein